jgi:hypothetical protein
MFERTGRIESAFPRAGIHRQDYRADVSVYPDFVSTFQQLMHLDESDPSRRWPAIVERICVPS